MTLGLDQALSIARSSLKVNGEAFQVISDNIANAHTPGYMKKQVSTTSVVYEGVGSGVKIGSLTADIDSYIFDNMIAQQSISTMTNTINEYYNKLQIIIGDPNQKNYISAALDNFNKVLSSLTSTPDNESSRLNAVNGAVSLASMISDNANKIQQLRHKADQDISSTIAQINDLLSQMKSLNTQCQNAKDPNYAATITNQQNKILQSLSALLNINTFEDANGGINISTSGGISILDQNAYSIVYSPAVDVNAFIKDVALNPISVTLSNSQGGVETSIDLVSGGQENNIISKIHGGVLSGLQQIRDIELPHLLEKLDNLAYQLSSLYNADHNTGGGYNPPTTLIGQNKFASSDSRDWSGEVRIAMVDSDGNPIKRAHEGANGYQRDLRPLVINLSKLDSGNGPGVNISMDTILKEINQYYFVAPVEARVKMGDMRGSADPTKPGGIEDIKLVSSQTSITPGGTFSFDFEIDNAHRNSYNVEVLSLAIDNGGTVTSTNNSVFLSMNGTRERTGNNNVVTLGGAGGTYTITALIKIQDEVTGDVSVSNITYKVTDSLTNAMNQRFSASSASGADTIKGTDGGSFISATSMRPFMVAEIVDSSGNTVSPGKEGYIKLKSLNGEVNANGSQTLYSIVMDDLTSVEEGLDTASSIIPATKKGLSHFLGLNNLFVENPTVRGSAYAMGVRSDIASNANLLSIAKLSPSTTAKDTVDLTGNTYASASFILNGPPSATGDTLTVNDLVFTFDNLGATSTTIDVSSADVPTIVKNIVNKLNANNATLNASGVNLATYKVNSSNLSQIDITANAMGKPANSFTIKADLSNSGSTASLNKTTASTVSGTLEGGTDGPFNFVTNKTYSYSLARGNTEVINAMLADVNKVITFPATYSFDEVSVSLVDFANLNYVSYAASKISIADQNKETESALYDQYFANYTSGVGVNINEELVNMVKFQASYNATAKIISTIQELFDTLLMSI